MRSWSIPIALSAGLLVVLFLPALKADEQNKQTVVTFDKPVEIPGQVLAAGTYVFRVADTMTDPFVVQIFNKDENHLYATLLADPDYRLEPTQVSL